MSTPREWHWLDTTTWKVNPPTGEVDTGRGRTAAALMISWWLLSWGYLVGLVALAWIGLSSSSLGEHIYLSQLGLFVIGDPILIAVVLQVWQRVRRRTGYPVIAEDKLADAVPYGAALLQFFHDWLDDPISEELSARRRAQALKRRRELRRDLNLRRRRLVISLEAAALFERWGWTWLRRRSSAKVLGVVDRLHLLLRQLYPEAVAGAENESTEGGDAQPAEAASEPPTERES